MKNDNYLRVIFLSIRDIPPKCVSIPENIGGEKG
jgi:hypothetical protein